MRRYTINVGMQRSHSAIAILIIMATLVGCSSAPINPSFTLTTGDARTYLAQCSQAPAHLECPVVVLAGYLDPGLVVGGMAQRLERLFVSNDRPIKDMIISVPFGSVNTFDDARRRVIDRVAAAFGGAEGEQPIEVDVVAISMGGLIARSAAIADDSGDCIHIRRLFTIATPHRGADMAALPTFNNLQRDMRCGSTFLETLEAAYADRAYEMIPYVRLGDGIVGEVNAAPPGEVAWWVPNKPLEFAHISASEDERFLADIVRRLRGEPPFTTTPRHALPGSEAAGELNSERVSGSGSDQTRESGGAPGN